MKSLTSFQQPDFPPEPSEDVPTIPEGVDPAALLAARTAAVANTRRQNARISLVQDLLRIICVVVLIAGIAWIVHQRHQQHMEEARLAAERAQAEQIAREKEREADAARLAAMRKAQMEAKQAADAERMRREAERRRAMEQNAEAARIQRENVKRYKSAYDRFNGTILNMISAAPPADLPAKVVTETWFSCLVPGGPKGVMLYEVRALPGLDIRVSRLNDDGKTEDIPFETFSSQIAKTSFLLSKGSYCYYSPANAGRWEIRVPVPADGETLNPSQEDFRDLYNVMRRKSLVTTAFTYDVFFRDFGGAETRILTVPFGGTVTRNAVMRGLQSAAGQQKQSDSALRARINQGGLVIRHKGAKR